MNTDQIGSLVRSILKIIGSLFAAHGLQDTATLLNTPDFIAAMLIIVSLAWSHFSHADPNAGTGAGGSKLGLVLAFLLPLLLVGCATSYKAEKAADITVTAAMTAWGDYVAQNHPPVSQELAVKAAFEKFQSAELVAVDSSLALLDVSPTNSIAKNLALANNANAKAALAELINVLRGFGVKL